MDPEEKTKLAELESRQAKLSRSINLLQQDCNRINDDISTLRLKVETPKVVTSVESAAPTPVDKFVMPETPAVQSQSSPPPLPATATKSDELSKPRSETKSATVPTDKEPSTNWELQLGQTWLVRIGVLSLLTGLIFLSNYAYQNWIYDAPAALKVAFFMAISLGLTGAGIFFEKRKEELKTYGQVISAGGLAAAYYTIYAAHFVESLHCINSPIMAAVLLTAWAGLMLAYACWKESKIISIMATGMAFYGTIVNPSGGLALFSSLILSASGMFMLLRYKWTSVGIVTVSAAYIAHVFWFDYYPSAVTDTTRFLYLASYWLLFSFATSLFTGKSLDVLPSRIITAINNSAVWLLSAFLLPSFIERPQLGMISLGIGGLLLICGQLSQRSLVWPKHLSHVFTYKGIFLITVGIIVEASGYSRFLILALEAIALLAAGHRMNQPLLKAGSIVIYAISLITAVATSGPTPDWPSYLVLTLTSMVYAGALRISLANEKSNESSIALFPAIASWVILYFGVFQSLSPALALSSTVLCSGLFWLVFLLLKKPAYLKDVALLTPLVALITGANLVPLIGNSPPQLAFVTPFVLLGFWWTSSTSTRLVEKFMLLQPSEEWKDSRDFGSWLFSILSCVLSLYLIESLSASAYIWLWAGGVLAIGGHILGKFTKRLSIIVPSQVFHITAISAAMNTSSSMGWLPLILILIHCALADYLWKSTTLVRYALAPAAVWAMLVQTQSPEIHFTLLGLAFYLWASFRKDDTLAISGGIFALFVGTIAGLPYSGYPELIDYLPMASLLVVAALPFRNKGPASNFYNFAKHLATWGTLAVVFIEASCHVLHHFDGKGLAICWALLALAIFSVGLLLQKRSYRLVGLLWLAASIVHIVTIDVMELNTLARIFSFIILGLTLMALGYLYNRYQDRIKRYL